MSDPIDASAFNVAATSLIEEAAARLTRRLGLPPCDQEDLKQELWLYLLLWQHQDIGDLWRVEPLIQYAQIAQRVRRLADLFVRSPMLRRQFRPHRERPSSHWLGRCFAAEHVNDSQRRAELRLDMALVLTRLPDDLRNLCEHLLSDTSLESIPPEPPELPEPTEPHADVWRANRAVAALRRVFRSHHLHEYL